MSEAHAYRIKSFPPARQVQPPFHRSPSDYRMFLQPDIQPLTDLTSRISVYPKSETRIEIFG